jgi:hypothetical protein
MGLQVSRGIRAQTTAGNRLRPDHVHMCIAIPPKHPVASVIAFLKYLGSLFAVQPHPPEPYHPRRTGFELAMPLPLTDSLSAFGLQTTVMLAPSSQGDKMGRNKMSEHTFNALICPHGGFR